MEQEVHDGVHGEMRLAVASSADTPRAVEIGKAAMKILEVMTHRVRTIDIVPGKTFYDVLMRGWEPGYEGHLQVGRSPPLSSDKSKTHFPILKEATGVWELKLTECLLRLVDEAISVRPMRLQCDRTFRRAKAALFPSVPYEQMLFFDDSAWSDHCAMVERACPGVVTQRTPRGMQYDEWQRGLHKFADARS
eukprot:scaffold47886_cov37-Tisochrysis_lutea.AAC.2